MNVVLDPDRIIATIDLLEARIVERFPDSSLSRVGRTVGVAARSSKRNIAAAARPQVAIRIAVGLFILVVLAILVSGVVAGVAGDVEVERVGFLALVGVVESAINDLVLVGAAIFFLLTIEARLKRRKVLAAIDQLRELAHIIDMHQLRKDPERVFQRGARTASSPRRALTAFELSRYLDYCSELLSLLGKIAALYVQGLNDAVVIAAIDSVQNLTTGLSRKCWQKIMVLERAGFDPTAGAGAAAGP